MRKTSNFGSENRGQLAVGIDELKELLCCGRATAEMIGRAAGAEIRISSRRKLFNTEKIRDYLDSVCAENNDEV